MTPFPKDVISVRPAIAKLLATGQHNISEVAYLTGFSSPSYFSKCFLQQFNMSPTDYIDQQGKPGKIDWADYTEV